MYMISPLLDDIRQYKLGWLPRDLIAGLSIAAVQVPTAVAYAQLAGFSPEVGLYASILPVIVYAFLGSSRQLVVGPDAATCTMVASIVAPLAAGDMVQYIAFSSVLSLLVGILMIAGGLSRMGFIVNFFSRPILIGFLNGIAFSIIVGQMAKLLGISLKQDDFLPSLIELCRRVPEANLIALTVGVITLIMLVLFGRFAPKAPGSLIALIMATIGLMFAGDVSSKVALVGTIPAGLPHLSVPLVEYHRGQGLFVSALGLVIVSFTSGMLTARSFAARCGSSLDANKEMLALGAANLVAGLSGSFAITGADSRTAVNVASGNKTQLASVIAALSVAAVAAWMSNMLGYVPLCALAAVLIFSAVKLIDFSSYKELTLIDKFEFRLSILTTVGVLTIGVLPGVALAIAFALILVMVRIYKPDDAILAEIPGLDGFNDISLSDKARTIDGLIVWRFEGPLVFFNADHFKDRIELIISNTEPPAKWFVISLESVTQIDATGLQALDEVYLKLQASGVQLIIARPKLYMRRLREKTSIGTHITENIVFPTIRAAVASTGLQTEGASEGTSFGTFYRTQDDESKTGGT